MHRQHRHDLKHDKFVDEIGQLSSRARANQRLLISIGGAAVLLAVIIYGIYFYRSNREENAQKALAVAIETFEAPVGEQPQQPVTTGPKFKTEQERTAASEKLFRDLQSSYSGTDAGDVAGLYLARIAVTKNDVKTARTLLEKFVSEQEGHLLAAGARFSLYQLRIENGEAAQVATELNAELAKDAKSAVLPGDALLELLGQAYEIQGDSAKAREAYRRLTNEYPESPYALQAQRRIGA